MRTYITTLTLCGIKNIDQEITLNFHNKKLCKEFLVKDHNIKAIYGENGAGKSAIVHAMDIYHKVMMNSAYLNDQTVNRKLNQLINKTTNELKIEITFVTYDEIEHTCHTIHSHLIVLAKDLDKTFYIKEEKLEFKKPSSYHFEVIYHQKDGELQTSDYISDDFRLKCMNLLSKQCVCSIWIHKLATDDLKYDKKIFRFHMVSLIRFALSIEIYINESDVHDDYKGLPQMLSHFSNISKNHEVQITNELDYRNDLKKYYIVNSQTDVIEIEDLQGYLKKVNRLTMFMKLLKEDLLSIDVETKENTGTLLCEKYFVYDGYRINIEFESTGIKKLVRLFDTFEAFVNGKIVFIDELDANIHDVYLLKLLEYFILYGEGQLCFTTHNLGPMEILRKQKHSIDFLSQDSHITPWKKNGNYSVIHLYRDGMIEHNPFNIEAIDFSGIFEAEEE